MKTETLSPSLFDCVVWALDRPGLHKHDPDTLLMLFNSHAPQYTYCLANEYGRIYGVALAYDESETAVRIAFIATDGSKTAIESFVSRLRDDFPLCQQITFKRRDREYVVPVARLGRMLTLKSRN